MSAAIKVIYLDGELAMARVALRETARSAATILNMVLCELPLDEALELLAELKPILEPFDEHATDRLRKE